MEMMNYFILFFLINVCWFCFGGNELSWTGTINCFLIGSSAVQVFSFLVHLLWLFSMHTLFGGEPGLWEDGSFWVLLWCFAFLSDFNITFVSAKKKNPDWMVSPDRKLWFFKHGSLQIASGLTLSYKLWKWKIALYNSPLDVDPSMEYACFCILLVATRRLVVLSDTQFIVIILGGLLWLDLTQPLPSTIILFFLYQVCAQQGYTQCLINEVVMIFSNFW